jgi:hypothetical protein
MHLKLFCIPQCYNFFMKRSWFILTFLAFGVALSSCQAANERPIIFKNGAIEDDTVSDQTTAIEAYTITLDPQTMQGLIDLSMPFLVYVGNPACSSCINFQPQLKRWIQDESPLVFYINTLTTIHEPSLWQSTFPEHFQDPFSTPTLFLFKGQQRLFIQSSQQAFYQLARFKSLMSHLLQIGIHRYESQLEWSFQKPSLIIYLEWLTLPDIFSFDWLSLINDVIVHLVPMTSVATLPDLILSSVPELTLEKNLFLLWNQSPIWISLSSLASSEDLRLWLTENVL